MPRSRDPRNYGQFYEKLALLMDKGERDIRLQFTSKIAIYHRNNFYAYINAWKHRAEGIPRSKVIEAEKKPHLLELAIRREDVLRRYLVRITPDPNHNDLHPDTLVELRFVLRELDERAVEGIEQLDKLLDKATGQSYDEMLSALRRGPAPISNVDIEKKMRAKDSPVAHFFGGVDTKVDDDMTDELADEILHADPPDRTDMTDLITPDNQAAAPTPDYQKEAFEAAEKLREKERK
jgi:hypothetical protein